MRLHDRKRSGPIICRLCIGQHNVTKVAGNINSNIAGSHYDEFETTLEGLWKGIFNMKSETRSEMEGKAALAVVVTKAKDDSNDQIGMTKQTSLLQWHVVKADDMKFEDALQPSFLTSSNGLKFTMLSTIEQYLVELVHQGSVLYCSRRKCAILFRLNRFLILLSRKFCLTHP